METEIPKNNTYTRTHKQFKRDKKICFTTKFKMKNFTGKELFKYFLI